MAEGGKEPRTDISEEDLKLLDAFHALRTSSKHRIEKTEDLITFMKEFDPHEDRKPESHQQHWKHSNIPRLSIFYGEEGKGEVSFATWKYEVKCLIEEATYQDEQILLSIRRSCKGEAANILRRLGTRVSPRDILRKFDGAYQDHDSDEAVLKQLYAVEQREGETVAAYCFRLEDICAEAVERRVIEGNLEQKMKGILYEGLREPLKQMTTYKFDTITDYDRFKIEVRKIEKSQVTATKEKQKTSAICKAATDTKDKEEGVILKKLQKMEENQTLLMEKIKALEKDKEIQTERSGTSFYNSRGARRGTYRDNNRGRGRGCYKPTRPTGALNFQPTCYICDTRGHIARNCTNRKEERTCYHCQEKGHIAKDCPKG